MYTIALLLIISATLFGVLNVNKANNKILFNFLFLLLTAMTVFRYGQGQDYFGYQFTYEHEFGLGISLQDVILRGDPGFRLLEYYARLYGIGFELFASLVGFVTMSLFYVFLRKHCRCSSFALLVFYSVVWIIYVISALRQGLAMGIWLCFAYGEIEKGRWNRYLLFTGIAMTMHLSASALLIIPIFDRIKSARSLVLILLASMVIMFAGSAFMSRFMIGEISERLDTYTMEPASSNFLFSRFVRIAYMLPIIWILIKTKDRLTLQKCKIITGLFLIFALMSFSELASGRLWGYITPVIVALLTNAIGKMPRCTRPLIVLYYSILVIVLYFHNVNAMIGWGQYPKDITAWNFPYISVFNKSEASMIGHEYNVYW